MTTDNEVSSDAASGYCAFLPLPPELRVAIYELVVPHGVLIFVGWDIPTSYPAAIANTNKEICRESLRLLYERNNIYIGAYCARSPQQLHTLDVPIWAVPKLKDITIQPYPCELNNFTFPDAGNLGSSAGLEREWMRRRMDDDGLKRYSNKRCNRLKCGKAFVRYIARRRGPGAKLQMRDLEFLVSILQSSHMTARKMAWHFEAWYPSAEVRATATSIVHEPGIPIPLGVELPPLQQSIRITQELKGYDYWSRISDPSADREAHRPIHCESHGVIEDTAERLYTARVHRSRTGLDSGSVENLQAKVP